MRAASSPMEPLNKNILLAGEVIAEKWKIGEKIGEGTFSQIYSAYSIESRDKVAVKVEAPSSLKPVLEWESLILKSLQDCPYVCRYYYHGKHGDSTVLVMELLGDSMSMLRISPDSMHGVPLAKAVSVGLEMLDCIEAFHRHGYVHRDIKASNFALSAIPERNPMKQARYYIIDFGLSRQHIGEDRQVLPARPVAEFRGTSMYASLSSHRRQELGPKDDLWSWFYLVLDFLRGELPWANDAQQKNRQTVLSLKEHFTEKNPGLLVEGLPGATQLLEMMDYLQSLKYEDFPDYAKIRKQLQAVGESSLVSENSDSGDEESSADRKEAQAVAAVSEVDWSAIDSERERALVWAGKAEEQKNSDGASDLLLTIAKRYNTFFDTEGLSFNERVWVQGAVYRIEKKSRAKSSFLAPPPIQSFVKRRQSEQKMRSDALRKRRERDFQVRQSLELQNEQRMAMAAPTQGSSEIVRGIASREGTPELQNGVKRPVKSESSMEVSDSEDVEARRHDHAAASVAQAHANARPSAPSVPMPPRQPPSMMPPGPPGNRWDHGSSHGAPWSRHLAISGPRNLRARLKVDTIHRRSERIVDTALSSRRSLLGNLRLSGTMMSPGRGERSAVMVTSGLKSPHEKMLVEITRFQRSADMEVISGLRNLRASNTRWRGRRPAKKKNTTTKRSDSARTHVLRGVEEVAHGADPILGRRRVRGRGRTRFPRRGRKVESKKAYSRKQRARSRSSSRSRSPSASPPTKRYRRRSSDLSQSKSSHRHSSRRRSHSSERPRDYPPKYQKEHSPREYPKEYSKEYSKSYPKEYAKDYPKEYVESYPKKYPSKDYPTKEYRRRSPSPDRRHSHSRELQYRRSPSEDRHRSHSRDYGREDGYYGEKHRRSSRWQPRS
ncbi:hypothetical protein PHYSODRAFT_524024 [Phytophthora sojae]|uniref:Casein kinase I n=1 Tax=Phytophthora sojae (strain P6497) TaxID=1094619 RepID=G5A698_PHYSP|nr:hypothetical protein PHYSODRAFT_524024 [Phytophthora sojae]EGZ08853.1 hypothetical protein PHYSODRAFT_524024 [Phytophthora sojae]|eukprot:XP_009535486.1 hypothetical protein PHYSODRAFT_524024 [Phytophthora sojae]